MTNVQPDREGVKRQLAVRALLALASVLAACLAPSSAAGGDWPMQRHDIRRSGVTDEALASTLQAAWVYPCAQPPAPAWPEPGKNLNRLDFDYAAPLVVAEGLVCFGSSADDTVRALDARTGALRWQFVTGGPVRFPPQIVGDRVYVGSDDGAIYCLETATGKEVWRVRGGPFDERVIGNGRVVSRWPIRTGVLVDKGIVYAVAGMWPADGIFIYALDAATGKTLWCNDTAGSGIPRVSHGPYSLSGLNPQGALAATDEVLLIPNGRCAPASVDRRTGALLAYAPGGPNNGTGASWLTVESNLCYTLAKSFYSPRVVNAMTIPQLTLAGGAGGAMPQNCIFVGDWQYSFFEDHVAQLVYQRRLFARVACGLIRAGDQLVVGENGQVRLEDVTTTNTVWSAPVSGGAYELAAADGRLYVSTDAGEITCFAPGGKQADTGNQKPEAISQNSGVRIQNTETKSQKTESGNLDPEQSKIQNPKSEIISPLCAAGMDRGYAVVFGDADGKLARALAAQTRLHVVSALPPVEAQALQSELLATTAFYGSRIHVLAATNLSAIPLPHWIANAVIVAKDVPELDAKEFYRLLRPAGGVLLAQGWPAERWQAVVRDAAIPEAEMKMVDGWQQVVRGRLEGAWDWDSKASGDELVKWPMRLQWFGEPGAAGTYNRKVQASTVVAANGRFFVIGDTSLTAVDAYNGYVWWKRPLPFAPRGVGYLHANADSLYLTLSGFRGGTSSTACILLDPLTGHQQKLYAPYADPPHFSLQTPQTWPVRSQDKKGTETEEGTVTLARDAEGLTVTLKAGKTEPKLAREWGVFLDFRPPERRLGLYEAGVYHLRVLPPTNAAAPVLWRAGKGEGYPAVRVSGSGTAEGSALTLTLAWKDAACLEGQEPASFGFAAMLTILPEFPTFPFLPRAPQRQALLFCGPSADGLNDGWAEIRTRDAAPAASPRPALLAGAFADLPKAKPQGKGQTLGGAVQWSLRTHPLTGTPVQKFWFSGDTCGRFSLSHSMALARSGMLGFYDFAADDGWHFFNGVRPSCGYSSMAANGIAFASSGGSGCDCSYSFLTSVALSPAERRLNEDWSVFGEWPVDTVVRQAHLNFGAPGDRKDDAGDLWLGFPRPVLASLGPVSVGGANWHNIPGIAQKNDANKSMALAVPLALATATGPGMGPYRMNADRTVVSGTDKPWLYASGLRGLRQATLTLDFLKPLVAASAKTPPTLDGKVGEAEWGAPVAELKVTKTRIYLACDAEALYVAAVEPPQMDRGGGAWNTSITNRDGEIIRAHCLELFLKGTTSSASVYLGVSAGGAQYDARSEARGKPYDPRWNATWRHAVSTDTNAFAVEMTIPWAELAKAGVSREGLGLNLQMSSWHNLGEALLTLGAWGRNYCDNYVPVGFGQPPVLPARTYTVRLHFAEPDDAPPGRRVFDVLLQGQPMLKDFDIAKVAGPRRAVVKEFPHVLAQETLTLEFKARSGSAPDAVPVLCGLEVTAE